jgi:hypothetical protein
MVHRIIVNVVDGGKEVPFGAHESLGAAAKDSAASGSLLIVPGMTGAPMKTAQLIEQLQDIGRFDQRMVMVRQHAPCDNARAVLLQHVEQGRRKAVHAVKREANVRRMFIAGSRYKEVKVSVIRAVRWGVPRIAPGLAPDEKLFALLGRELAPDVMPGHVKTYGVPASAGGISLPSSARNISKASAFWTIQPPKGGTPYTETRLWYLDEDHTPLLSERSI